MKKKWCWLTRWLTRCHWLNRLTCIDVDIIGWHIDWHDRSTWLCFPSGVHDTHHGRARYCRVLQQLPPSVCDKSATPQHIKWHRLKIVLCWPFGKMFFNVDHSWTFPGRRREPTETENKNWHWLNVETKQTSWGRAKQQAIKPVKVGSRMRSIP